MGPVPVTSAIRWRLERYCRLSDLAIARCGQEIGIAIICTDAIVCKHNFFRRLQIGLRDAPKDQLDLHKSQGLPWGI